MLNLSPPPALDAPMPHCGESEKGLLSCILQDPNLFDEAASCMTEDHFFLATTKPVWNAIMAQQSAHMPVDVVTIISRLRDQGVLDAVGGSSALSELYTFVPIPSHFGYYRDRLILMHTKRAAIRAGWAVIASAHSPECDDRMKLIGRAEEAVNDLHGGLDVEEVKPFRMWLSEAVDFVEEQVQRGGALSGMSTGIDAIDQRTLGICPGEAWIIAGGTSDGKTSLAMQICRALFSDQVPTAYYLTESSGVRLTLRALASAARINLRAILTGTLTKGDQMALGTSVGRMSSMPFYLRHKPGISLQALLADMRMLRRKFGVKVFFVDYIQRIDNSERESREQQIAEISRRLTDFANKTGTNVFMLSQLNENGAVRESRAPTHDADVILSITCPVEKDLRGNVTKRDETKRLISIGKARNAERGGKPLLFEFNGALQTFSEIIQDDKL